MAKITFKGNEVNTNGSLPAVGAEAPDFKGVTYDSPNLDYSDRFIRIASERFKRKESRD